MPREQTTISTRDGECPAHVFRAGAGRKDPAVIFYMDAGGIRPAALGMAERLSKAGYLVLLPDLFYRYGSYGPFDPKEVFKGNVRAILGPLMATTGNAKAAEDTEAFLAYLDTRSDVQATRRARSASVWAAAWRSRRRPPGRTASPPSPAFTAEI